MPFAPSFHPPRDNPSLSPEAAHDGLDAEVQYVDYGNFEEVKEVWEMPPELMSLPAQV